MTIMKFSNWVKVVTESIKDSELDRILDKISSGSKLTSREQSFLNDYSNISDSDLNDHSFLSLSTAYDKVKHLLSLNKKVICDLVDRYGKIGIQVVKIEFDYSETCILYLKNGEKTKMKDNMLYNISYNMKRDEYSIEKQDEYYEKIPISNN